MPSAPTTPPDTRRAHRLFAAAYDLLGPLHERGWLGDRRRELLRAAAGTVVELGAGTGANVPHYPAAVTRLVLTEPDAAMRARLARRLGRRRAAPPAPPEIVPDAAERLRLPDGCADTVVATLVLCSVEDPGAALAEARRVLRPGGRLLLLEHVRGRGRRARWQDRLTPLWRRCAGGCHLNRDTVGRVRAAGFAIERLEVRDDGPGPAVARPTAIAVAAPAGPEEGG